MPCVKVIEISLVRFTGEHDFKVKTKIVGSLSQRLIPLLVIINKTGHDLKTPPLMEVFYGV